MNDTLSTWTAFRDDRKIAAGSLGDVLPIVRAEIERNGQASVLVFDDATGRQVDFPLHAAQNGTASPSEPEHQQRGPGRPKLGVVAREVTLLPRHWDWLGSQPGGASVALRRLVDEARSTHAARDRARQAQGAADRFMGAMAGNQRGYEDAARALYAGDKKKFDDLTESWPADIRDHARLLAAPAFASTIEG